MPQIFLSVSPHQKWTKNKNNDTIRHNGDVIILTQLFLWST